MSEISVQAIGFKDGYANMNGARPITISREKCIKYAVNVGNAHFSQAFAISETATSLAAYRAMAIRCVLDFDSKGLKVRPEYYQLEASEKSNLSYWIGMTMTAIAAEAVVGVSKLTHASRQHRLARKSAGKSLADLVGRDSSGDWHVFEAKSRQRSPTATDSEKWKKQAETVETIMGQPISTSSYCLAKLGASVQVTLVDPPPSGKGANLITELSTLKDGYYESLRAWLKGSRVSTHLEDRKFVAKVIGFDPVSRDFVFLGLDSRLVQFDSWSPGLDRELSLQTGSEYEWKSETKALTVAPSGPNGYYIGTDGIAIISSSDACEIVR